MLSAQRAVVAPRAFSPWTGSLLLLEDLVDEWLSEPRAHALCLLGGAGMGKTTALRHLASRLSEPDVDLIDDAAPTRMVAPWARRRVVFTADRPHRSWQRAGPTMFICRLAPWDRDALLEWLLPHGSEACASVLARLQAAAEPDWPAGNPELWSLALQRMVDDRGVDDAPTAVVGCIEELVGSLLREVEWICLHSVYAARIPEHRHRARFRELGGGDDLLRLLRHRALAVRIAARAVARDILRGVKRSYMKLGCPRDLVRDVAAELRADAGVVERLRRVPPRRRALQPLVHSVMHRLIDGWRPPREGAVYLKRADLEGVRWHGVALAGAHLRGACLDRADLHGADLRAARLERAHLRGADLRGSDLRGIFAVGADLEGADLREARAASVVLVNADLNRARLDGADLSGANLTSVDLGRASLVGARLAGADFDGARLAGSDLSRADLRGARLLRQDLRSVRLLDADLSLAWLADANLEGLDLTGIDLERADLSNCLLTGTWFPDARLAGANLRGAGLAEVEWERANLRNADLRGAVFHVGSSRSGLVGSTIPSEGSRTGFYTDEYHEQTFRAPEEIRKANLRGADVRGASLDGVDLYLVDLRDARCDPGQRAMLQGAGAIV